MADWLVLSDFRARIGITTYGINVGQVITDASHDIPALQRAGAALLPWSTEINETVLAWLAANRGARTGLADALLARGSGSGVPGMPGVAAETTAPLDLYVDPVAGDDAAPGTLADPLRTLTAARTRFPARIHHKVRVLMVPGTYELPSFVGPSYRAPLELVAWQNGALATGTVLLEGVADAGSDAITCVVPGGGLGVDAFRGKSLRMLDGVNAGKIRHLKGNSATDLDVGTVPFDGGAIGVGDAFQVFEPPVVLEVPMTSPDDTLPLCYGIGGEGTTQGHRADESRFVMVNCALQGAAGTPADLRLVMSRSKVVWMGVEVRDTKVNPIPSRSEMLTGATSGTQTAIGFDDLGAVNPTDWQGWGYHNETEDQMFTLDQTGFEGYLIGARMFVLRNSVVTVTGGSLRRNGITGALISAGGGQISAFGNAALPLEVQQAGAGPALECRAGSFVDVLGDITLASGAGAVVRCSGGKALVAILAFGVVGASSAGFGSDASLGGRITWRFGGPTITGVAGDNTVDGVASVANGDARWAAPGPAASMIEAQDASVIQRVG
jgi:hypothetical protein